MPPQVDPADWDYEIWAEWASCLPWSPTAKDKREQRKHRQRRVAKHHYRLWDKLQKVVAAYLTKEYTTGYRLPPWHYKRPRNRGQAAFVIWGMHLEKLENRAER